MCNKMALLKCCREFVEFHSRLTQELRLNDHRRNYHADQRGPVAHQILSRGGLWSQSSHPEIHTYDRER